MQRRSCGHMAERGARQRPGGIRASDLHRSGSRASHRGLRVTESQLALDFLVDVFVRRLSPGLGPFVSTGNLRTHDPDEESEEATKTDREYEAQVRIRRKILLAKLKTSHDPTVCYVVHAPCGAGAVAIPGISLRRHVLGVSTGSDLSWHFILTPASLSTFHMVWEKTYNMSVEIASLNYLSLGIGFIIGLQISHPLMDKVCRPLSCSTNNH